MYKKCCFIISVLLLSNTSFTQTAYSTDSVVENFYFTTSINTSATQFKQLQGQLTIIDFFGTWCIPCIKALPHLTALQQRFKDSISIVLLSTEQKKILETFIAKRKINFPVIVDESSQIANLFQPPSYPYTVVINNKNKVVYIGNANSLSDSIISQLLYPPTTNFTITNTAIQKDTVKKFMQKISNSNSSNTLVAISQQLLYTTKTNAADSTVLNKLAGLSFTTLISGLQNDDDKKAFWINIYNAFTYLQLSNNNALYTKRNTFFKQKNIVIAGNYFSLDNIEHGIIRRSKIKWSLGYVNKFFPSTIEKKLRVDTVDYRIHFALNCGAKSCPPIAFYTNENIDTQLSIATNSYLQNEVKYKADENTVFIPKLFSWFKGDFGGRKGIYSILKKTTIIPATAKPTIKYLPYDWTLFLNNYKN